MTAPALLRLENGAQNGAPRLLLLAPWLAMGGADKFNLDLLAQLTRRGWAVTVVTTLPGDHSWLPHFARLTSDIVLLHQAASLTEYPRFLCSLIQSRHVDAVLLSNSELGYRLLPYSRAHCPAVTFVDFCHMEEESWRKGGYPRMSVDRQELLDLQIVASAYLKGWMVQRGAAAERVQVCHINIDAQQWQPDPEQRAAVRRELGVEDGVPVVLYAGRICPQKQPRVFARAVQRLAQRFSSFVALVAGDGPELEWLRAFVNKQGLEGQVRLLGAVANERVRELMAAADVFFLPSQWEGIALSLYEAMACALPVVGADVGGQRELVTPECGILVARSVEDSEAEHYAQALAALLQEPYRRQAMGQAGRRRVTEHFTLDGMGERMVALLQEARRLHETQPRPAPTPAVGRACAARTIRYLRVYAVLRRLLSPSSRALLDRQRKWLLPLKETLDRVLLR